MTPWTVARQAPLVHGVFQTRILEWIAIAYARGSSQSRDQTCITCVSWIGRQITPVPPGRPTLNFTELPGGKYSQVGSYGPSQDRSPTLSVLCLPVVCRKALVSRPPLSHKILAQELMTERM